MRATKLKFLVNSSGNQIIEGMLGIAILAVVTVSLSKFFFGVGKMKATVQARASIVDYESAFAQGVGDEAMRLLKNCSVSSLNNLVVPLGELGSAVFVNAELKRQLSAQLAIGGAQGKSQIELNSAINSCPDTLPSTPNSSPGVYQFCMMFKPPTGGAFKEMIGAFAKVRLDLNRRRNNATQRLMGASLSCDTFRNTTGQEIRVSYKIYFKRFNEETGIFSKAGTLMYSQD